MKLIYVLAPRYFPLIDNSIARTFGFQIPSGREPRFGFYIDWMRSLRVWLLNYRDVILRIEKELRAGTHDLSILKLVDEALYVVVSVDQRARAKTLRIKPLI